MNQQIRQFILRVLATNDGEPMADGTLKAAIRGGFAQAFTDADLNGHIRFCETQGWLIGVSDLLTGITWALTQKGKLRAAELK